ncbi:DoxX family protein [Chengkuizengella marina]|uniref:DoxX family protein n=1 Tax=Chengkuizengella marina TaxID=2507566 RepID=A0A6N9PY10_9BACL|nr:DoxX family protein [Chengkuizengella marina]NBI27495.1 DoxX family protein [Chengkuizengella marina]
MRENRIGIGLLIIRLVVGLLFIGHGSQKLFGFFGGAGLQGTGGFFESIGLSPGTLMAFIAGAGELVGGILLVLGFITPLASAMILVIMLGAIVKVHAPGGLWATQGGIEYPLVLLATVIGIAFIGSGKYSLDHYFFKKTKRVTSNDQSLS